MREHAPQVDAASPHPVDRREERVDSAGLESSQVLLERRPVRLDRIQFRRVRRQVEQPGARVLDHCAHGCIAVLAEVVEYDDVAWLELRNEIACDEVEEVEGLHRALHWAESDESGRADRADQRDVVAPVHRSKRARALTHGSPRSRRCHRDVAARFVDEDELLRVDLFDRFFVPSASLDDVFAMLLRGAN